jgi:hypothetical protein
MGPTPTTMDRSSPLHLHRVAASLQNISMTFLAHSETEA